MLKVTANIKNRIITLYKDGTSLKKLSKDFGIGKSTLYYHIRKNYGRIYPESKFNPAMQSELGEVIGAFVGDGNFFFNPINYSYNIRFYFGTKEEDYAKHISKLIKMLFGDGCKINIWRYPGKAEIILKMQRKAIYDKIKEYIEWQNKKALTVKVKGSIKNYSDNFIRGVIRGLIASDGDVDIKYKRVTLSTSSKNLAKQYSE